MTGRHLRWLAAAAVLALLAGCGRLPRPFEGDPGKLGHALVQPPPSRLAVPPPGAAMLPDAASAEYAKALVAALQDKDVPAVAEPARRGDWSLGVSAELRGDKVVPSFSVFDPSGLVQGSVQGTPADAAQWAAGTPAALRGSAAADAGNISILLTRIEAARQRSDPNSLLNRPARVWVRDVAGAPGDGNRQLTRQMRLNLPKQGEIVQDAPDGADYSVEGKVDTAAGAGGTERIEIQWTVRDAQSRELGKVVQLNEVPPGSLDQYWGDVAVVVAQEAAGGIADVIHNQTSSRAAAPPVK